MATIPPPGSSGPTQPGTGQSQAWHDGQLLRAVVERGSRGPGETAILQIGRQRIPVAPQLPLARGIEVLVQVVRQQQALALKLLELPRPPEAPPPPRLAEQFLSQTRQLAPQQESPTRLLALLRAVATATGSSAIPEPVRELARQALGRIPDARQVENPATLRRAVDAALAAARPATGTATPRSDPAAGFHPLITRLVELLAQQGERPTMTHALRPPLPTQIAPPQPAARWNAQALAQLTGPQLMAELLAAARGTEARQILQQLAGLEVAASGTQDARWHVELPVHVGDAVELVSLVIEREGRQDREGAAQEHWQATLALSLPGLGGIQARVGLRPSGVFVDFHVEEQDTLQRMEREIPRLHHALQARELAVQSITVRLGLIDEPERPKSQRLVDVNV